jgi:hypothetical protein
MPGREAGAQEPPGLAVLFETAFGVSCGILRDERECQSEPAGTIDAMEESGKAGAGLQDATPSKNGENDLEAWKKYECPGGKARPVNSGELQGSLQLASVRA